MLIILRIFETLRVGYTDNNNNNSNNILVVQIVTEVITCILEAHIRVQVHNHL